MIKIIYLSVFAGFDILTPLWYFNKKKRERCNMKKLAAAVCVILILAASCAKKDKNEITFAVGGAPGELKVWEEIARDFTSRKGIKVRIIRQPTDSDLRRQGLVVPLKAKKPSPDIFTMDVVWVAQFAASGWLHPIADTKINKKVFFEKTLKTADIYKGQMVAAPVNIDAGLLYYRKDIIKKPPETWAELELFATLHGQKAGGKCGYVWQGAQYEGLVCNFLEAAVSAGGGIVIEKGEARINTPQNVKALKFLAGTIHESGISPANTYTEMKEEEVRMVFQRGGALFERNWPYAWALHQKKGSPVKGKTGIAPLPHFKGGVSAAALGGWHAGISAYSEKKERAAVFLNFITSYDIQRKMALELGWNPARKDVYNDADVLSKMPHMEKLRPIFENAVARPNVPYYTSVSRVLQSYLNSALAGKTSPAKALKGAEKEINKIIKQYEG